jgi:hypothetical protein
MGQVRKENVQLETGGTGLYDRGDIHSFVHKKLETQA